MFYAFSKAYFWKTSCVDDNLVVLTQLLKEILHTWSFQDKDVADPALYIYWNYEVWFFDSLELTVHESFIQV